MAAIAAAPGLAMVQAADMPATVEGRVFDRVVSILAAANLVRAFFRLGRGSRVGVRDHQRTNP